MSDPVRVLELRSVRGTGGGPEKTILAGAALTDPAQFAITVCYIRDDRDPVYAIDQRAVGLGIDFVEVTERHSFDWKLWPALRALVRNRRIQIVHSHDYKTNFYAWLLSMCEPILPLATLHGYTGNSRRERVYYALDKRIVRRFPRLITVSDDLTRELVRTRSQRDRITRLLNGIDPDAFRRTDAARERARLALGLSPADVVIGSVGRLEHQKRFDLLMKAFCELHSRRPSAFLRLVIVGDGSQRAALESLRTRLGLGAACVLVGHRDDVVLFHQAFDVFVQSSDYEGTPNTVLEAMALETPIVATDVGGTSELVTDGLHGLIVPPGNPSAIASAVEEVLGNPLATNTRVRAARRRTETELSFRVRMAAVERVYRELLTDSRETLRSEAIEQSR
jgi:glycosyltransferase involved in cell wall biosynthesis